MDILKFCENCGAQIKPEASFCNVCLSKKTAEDSPLSSYSTEQQPLHRPYTSDKNPSQSFRGLKKLIKTLAFLLLMLFALIGLIGVLLFGSFFNFFDSKKIGNTQNSLKPIQVKNISNMVFYFTGDPNAGIQNQLESLKQGQIEKAYTYMSKEFKANISLANFTNFINNNPILKDHENSNVFFLNVHNDNAQVSVKLESKAQGESTVRYTLIKENGDWKIAAMNVATK